MTPQNLILTDKSIKNHSKRLKKELKLLKVELSLGETQNLFAKTLGFNNFHHLQHILGSEHKNTAASTVNAKLLKFIEAFEHSGSYCFIRPDGTVHYRSHTDEHNANDTYIQWPSKNFNADDFNSLTTFLLSKIPKYNQKMSETIILGYGRDNHHLIGQLQQVVDDGLYRSITFQVYFDMSKNINCIKLIINYTLEGDNMNISYDEAKPLLLVQNASVDFTKRKNKKHAQDRFFKLNANEHKLLNSAYVELYNACIDGNLKDLMSVLAKNRGLDLNTQILNRTWGPTTAVELALAFEHFHIVHYLLDTLQVDVHRSNDYLFRTCCIENTDSHTKVIKKMLTFTNFDKVQQKIGIHNLDEVSKMVSRF